MRWLTFVLVAALTLVLQSAVAPHVGLFGIWPDWLLVIVLFFALYAKPVDAVAGGWVVGALADLMTVERLGFLALSYGLAALLVTSIRDYLFRYRVMTQFVVVLAVSILLRASWSVYRRILFAPTDSLTAEALRDWLLGSFYTALWAAVVYRLLLSVPQWLGIARPRYTWAELHRYERKHV